MATGCIPVIMTDDVRQPGDDLLPYSDFSLRITAAETDDLARTDGPPRAEPTPRRGGSGCRGADSPPGVPSAAQEAILKAVPVSEVRRLQRGVEKYCRYFYWARPATPPRAAWCSEPAEGGAGA